MAKKEKRVATNVYLITIRRPPTEQSNTIIWDAGGCKGSGTSCMHGVTRDVLIEVLAQACSEPRAGRYGSVFA